MLRGRLWIQRASVTLLLLASLSARFLAVPHTDADDTACNPVAVTHDESAHYIGADQRLARSESVHCFLCHSLRSFATAFDRFQQHHDTPRTERLHFAPIDRAAIVAWTLLPGRAPPA